jgi:flagellin
LRINSAKDDAAGLAITNRMTSQIRGFAVAIRNSNDGISMAQTAEGAMGQVTSMLQRMRELSVQSANGAMSDADRGNIQQEVSQLKLQIDDVANKTNHNNIKLLDGSAGKVTLQTGVYANDTMDISFGSVKTKDIGLGSHASLSSVGTSFVSAAPTTATMADGDLLLNGVSVGASLAVNDTLSFDGNAASAIAKAAAINAVSEQSGVRATVGQTTVNGSVMTAATAATSGTITINGVATAEVTVNSDAELSRESVVTAINNISERTGVKAINSHDDSKGVMLVAADGRNVTLEYTTLTAENSGLAATGNTHTGTYELNRLDGQSITVGSQVDGTLSKSGLEYGTYASDVAQSVTLARTTATTTGAPAGVLNGNTLVINNVGIDAAVATDDDASYVGAGSTKSGSAIAIAAAINKKSDLTGVTATAQPNIINGTGFSSGALGADFKINGTTIAASGDVFLTRDDAIDAINLKQGQTGVVAEANGTGLRLIAQDGRNITIESTAANADADKLGLTGQTTLEASTTFYSKVQLSSDKAFKVDSGSEGNDTNFSKLGFRKGTFGGADNGLKVKDIDVTTMQGATDAIKAIDAAINTVSADQAKAGAFQNRLDAVVSNLTESTQNMSASRSRILDTDYATETTNLARSQIISQAATAMLAQANQSAQSVLSLLK